MLTTEIRSNLIKRNLEPNLKWSCRQNFWGPRQKWPQRNFKVLEIGTLNSRNPATGEKVKKFSIRQNLTVLRLKSPPKTEKSKKFLSKMRKFIHFY